jgi:hypothetical protein
MHCKWCVIIAKRERVRGDRLAFMSLNIQKILTKSILFAEFFPAAAGADFFDMPWWLC